MYTLLTFVREIHKKIPHEDTKSHKNDFSIYFSSAAYTQTDCFNDIEELVLSLAICVLKY